MSSFHIISRQTLECLLQNPANKIELQRSAAGVTVCIIRPEISPVYLGTARGQLRYFQRLDTAYDFLETLGLKEVKVVSLESC